MCGIIGALSTENVVPLLLERLHYLEYRGYDSAGLAIADRADEGSPYRLQHVRTVGKVEVLDKAVSNLPNKMSAHIGIAHTRWATHGKPTENNAHPQISNAEVAVVHNGIIENYKVLKQQLIHQGYVFASDTDTEVVAHLVQAAYQEHQDLLLCANSLLKRLEGNFALAILHVREPFRIVGISVGSPLVVVAKENGYFLASDPIALCQTRLPNLVDEERTEDFFYLEKNDVVDIQSEKIVFYNNGSVIKRKPFQISLFINEKKGDTYKHRMQQEIFEQPEAIQATLEAYYNRPKPSSLSLNGPKLNALCKQIKHVRLTACGTSYHAALIGSYWIEAFAGISAYAEIASEFRYRQTTMPDNSLFVTLSQSGETADTLAALNKAKQMGYLSTLAICNSPNSSLVRYSDIALMTQAGPEISIASTKAFITQLVNLLILSSAFMTEEREALKASIKTELFSLTQAAQKVLALESTIKKIAQTLVQKKLVLFLGRGIHYAIALEGALKLKEISYIHAQAYPAGEIKHGPLALIDESVSTVVLLPTGPLQKKTCSTIAEVKARNGDLIVLADPSANLFPQPGMTVLPMPPISEMLAPFTYAIALQLLAYHTAVIKGTDIDHPRHLAKAVTVE